MQRLLLGSVVFAALIAGPAMAADQAVKAYKKAPPPVAVFSWTGCYIGGNVGWIGGSDRFDNSPAGAYLTGVPGVAAISAAQVAALSASYSPRGSGITGGGQVGCNYQVNPLVWGVEADIQGSSLNESATAVLPAALGFFGHTETESKKLDWYSTFRGRVGISPWDRTLLYVTGGLAVAHVSSAFNLTFTNTDSFAGSASTTRTGWALGGGLEWAWINNWSLKAEYLYMNFGTWSYFSPNTMFVANGLADPRYTWQNSIRTREQVARIGLNYHFGGPVAAK
jgi:outer membrane immunogenic protein